MQMTAESKPAFEVGQRVGKANGIHSGRVQNVSYADGSFVYLVKWDDGPTTSHRQGELRHENLPSKYP